MPGAQIRRSLPSEGAQAADGGNRPDRAELAKPTAGYIFTVTCWVLAVAISPGSQVEHGPYRAEPRVGIACDLSPPDGHTAPPWHPGRTHGDRDRESRQPRRAIPVVRHCPGTFNAGGAPARPLVQTPDGPSSVSLMLFPLPCWGKRVGLTVRARLGDCFRRLAGR